MKSLLRVTVGLAALGLSTAMAAEKAADAREAQMEKVGALSGKLTLHFTQTLPKLISNVDGEGGAFDYNLINKLYNKALVAPQAVVRDESKNPPETRLQSAIDEANAKIQSINVEWTTFTQEHWTKINAKMNQCNATVGSLNHILLYGVMQCQTQWIASGADLSALIGVLEALDKRGQEVKAEAETGHIALWRKALADWEALAK